MKSNNDSRESKSIKLHVSFDHELFDVDSENQTWGCRHTNPDICGSNSLIGTCAFVNDDHICRKPSKAWKKQYVKLLALSGKGDN